MIDPGPVRERFTTLSRHLSGRERRLFAAREARAAGYGGIAAVSAATGIAASTIGRGLRALAAEDQLEAGRIRRPGGGCKPLVAAGATLLDDLLALVNPSERGDPMSPLRWTCKGLSQLASALVAKGHRIGRTVVGELLPRQKFSLQASRKTREGDGHPDRDAQFGHINDSVTAALVAGGPVIPVGTKKKELVGDFRNAGREWRPQGDPQDVRVHGSLIEELGRAVPYGIDGIAADTGWASVGMDHDTSAFAVHTIRHWWDALGRARYPGATRLVITADGGGSNGSRGRLWKRELQRLADELGIGIVVHHLPPGTSKWNKVEHRLSSFITMNWKAQPLASYRVIVDLVSATTTRAGLTVRCELDSNTYPKGIVVSDREMASLNIKRDPFHGEWNYTMQPRAAEIRAVDSG